MFEQFLLGVGNMFGNYINQLIGQSNTEANMAKQHAYNKDIMNLQHSMNMQNMLKSGQYERQSRENAGLNVNNGQPFTPVGTSAVGSTGPSGAQMSPVDFSQFIQLPLIEAQARNLNADAALKERELRGKQNADAIYGEGDITARTFINDEGQVEVEVLSNRSTPVSTKEGFDAVKDVTTFIRKDLNDIKASEAQSVLAKYVAQEQITNGAWSYLAKMPKADFENLCANTKVQKALENLYWQEGQLKVSEKELTDLQKEIQSESSIAKILDDISRDFENGDYLKALGGVLKGIFFSFLQVGGVNIGFNRSRSSSSSTNTSTVMHIK